MAKGKFAAASAALVAALLSTSAMAQVAATPSTDSAAPPEQEGGEILITGTRIRRSDLQSNSPLTIVGRDEIQYQGATTVESVLNRLPQFTADANDPLPFPIRIDTLFDA